MHVKYKNLLFIFIIFLGFQLNAQSPKTFYIGHSLSDQIPDMVQSLSNDHAQTDFSWVYQSIPGAPLRWQWDRKDEMDYIPISPNYYGFYDETYGLPAGDFDILILTEAVPRYGDLINETYAYADSFYRYATQYNPNIRVYLYEDWHCLLSGTPTGCDYDIDSNPWRQRLDDDLPMWESVVDTLNARFDPAIPVCMIPAGQGLASLYDSIQIGAIPGISSIDDIFSDNIHLTDIGKYYVACVHFAAIHKTSPVGLTHQLQVWWGGDFNAPSPAQALKFQEIAWEAVINYPGSCVEIPTSMENQLDDDLVRLFPNPTHGKFEIEGLNSNSNIQVMDITGKIHQTMHTSNNRIKVDIQSLPQGLYLIRIENENGQLIHVKKIIKQ